MNIKWIRIAVALSSALVLFAAPTLGSAASGPTISSQVALPLTLPSEQATLIAVVLEFAPGAGFPEHTHGAPVTVSVLEGEVTVHEEGKTKIYKPGETWTETPGHVHSAANEGTTTCKVLVTALLPDGAELTTPTERGKMNPVPPVSIGYQAAMPLSVPASDASLLGVVLDFAPGADLPNHVHGGKMVVLVLDGEISLTEEGAVKTYKAGESWTEAPGHVHSATNLSGAHTTVALAVLLPKGAELTTLVSGAASGSGAPEGMPRTGVPISAQSYVWRALLIPILAVLAGVVMRYRARR